MEDDDAIGIINFDHNYHDIMPVTPIIPLGRIIANGHISAYSYNPDGWISIGEAVARAHDLLDPVTGYDVKTMIILTDGRENHDDYVRRYISDVADVQKNILQLFSCKYLRESGCLKSIGIK